MLIDTAKRAVTVRFRFLAFAFVVVIGLAAFLITNILQNNPMPFIIAGVFVLAAYAYIHIRKFNYLYFSFQNNQIIFRYYNLIPTTLDHHSIEFPVREFVKFEIKTCFFGLRDDIIFYRKTRAGIAKYPPVSLSLFTKDEKNAIIDLLEKLSSQ